MEHPIPSAKEIRNLAWMAIRLAKIKGLTHSYRDDLHSDLVAYAYKCLLEYDQSGKFSSYYLRFATYRAREFFNKQRYYWISHGIYLSASVDGATDRLSGYGFQSVDTKDEYDFIRGKMESCLSPLAIGVIESLVINDATVRDTAKKLDCSVSAVCRNERDAVKKLSASV
jgi:DNA-directed RNA polymerase specialized sigma24 family protein